MTRKHRSYSRGILNQPLNLVHPKSLRREGRKKPSLRLPFRRDHSIPSQGFLFQRIRLLQNGGNDCRMPMPFYMKPLSSISSLGLESVFVLNGMIVSENHRTNDCSGPHSSVVLHPRRGYLCWNLRRQNRQHVHLVSCTATTIRTKGRFKHSTFLPFRWKYGGGVLPNNPFI